MSYVPGRDGMRRIEGGAFSMGSARFYPEERPVRAAQVDAFCDALRLFKLGYSWAGPVSLVVPYDLRAMRGTPPFDGGLVRFSIGLELAADLQADLAQALELV